MIHTATAVLALLKTSKHWSLSIMSIGFSKFQVYVKADSHVSVWCVRIDSFFINNHYLLTSIAFSEITESTSIPSYLDPLFIRDKSNNITTKLDDKRDSFGFHIVNFPFTSSNNPSAPAYGVYASQLFRYAPCCSNYSDFILRHRALVTRLLSQGYQVNRLSNTFKKFYGRHTNLVGQYKKNVCQMFADSIS